ncbi:MAG: dipeptidase [Bacteroidales bacterium]
MNSFKLSVTYVCLTIFFTLLSSSLLKSQSSSKTLEELQEQAAKIHKKILTVDTHNDTALTINNPEEDQGVTTGQVTFPLMKKGGLDASLFALYIGQGNRDKRGLDSAKYYVKDNLLRFRRYVEDYKAASLAYCSEDLLRNKRNGVTSVMLAIENGYAIGVDISNLEMFRDIGVRAITICHNDNNDICDASRDKNGPEHNGLSDFGREVIKEMNRLGIIVDVSHASVKTVFDVLEVSEAPIMASHSGVYAIKNHPRNLRDKEIIAIAEAGGLIQVATGRFFLSHLPKDSVTVKHLVDHIDYVKNLVGIDYVGLGTDFDGGGGVVGLENASKVKNITIELLRRGYTEEEIEKFWGANFIRFLKSQNL